jgi:glutamyl-tRNA synthetase
MKNKMFNLFKKKVITRIAPSPTGVLHFGTARTALFNYLYAKKHGGKFILRIEDTDKERSTKEFEQNILENMEWLGLKHDAFYRQSERGEIYKKYLEKLIKEDKAYISKEEGGERTEVIRFRNPNKKITFTDLIRGDITFDTTELGDFVIAKSMSEPLYHLAVVVDDYEMGITHIIRGEDGISNTPRQILIQEAIGARKTPYYAHLPLILGKDRSKMSKRHGPTSMTSFREKGYLKEALINYLAFLGWNPGDEREVFSINELIKEFSIRRVSKSGAIFDEERLNWYNREYLKKIDNSIFIEKVKKYFEKFQINDDKILSEIILTLKNIIIERINIFEDLKNLIETGDFDYFFETPEISDITKIIWKETPTVETIMHLSAVAEIIQKTDDEQLKKAETVKNLIWNYASENGKGNVLWPLRYSLSGKDKSPDPFVLISLLSKDEALIRIQNSIKKLNEKAI